MLGIWKGILGRRSWRPDPLPVLASGQSYAFILSVLRKEALGTAVEASRG